VVAGKGAQRPVAATRLGWLSLPLLGTSRDTPAAEPQPTKLEINYFAIKYI
jgi:hypothetical protein